MPDGRKRDQDAAGGDGQLAREAEAHGAVLGVDDVDGVGGTPEPGRGGGRRGRAAVGQDDRDRAAARVARAVAADQLARGVQAGRQRRAPPVRSASTAAAACSSGALGTWTTCARASRKATTATRSRRA